MSLFELFSWAATCPGDGKMCAPGPVSLPSETLVRCHTLPDISFTKCYSKLMVTESFSIPGDKALCIADKV